MSNIIVCELLHSDVQPPVRATARSAGYDLKAYLKDRTVSCFLADNVPYTVELLGKTPELTLGPGHRALVPLGFKAKLPDMNYAAIVPRSGKAVKLGLCVVNTPGTVDADYPGEWMVPVINNSSVSLTVNHGDAIAQAILKQYDVLTWSLGDVRHSTDRTGGFGSTGQ
jgi:dUTP pyrophosphatase